jgi:hypothetical protein
LTIKKYEINIILYEYIKPNMKNENVYEDVSNLGGLFMKKTVIV